MRPSAPLLALTVTAALTQSYAVVPRDIAPVDMRSTCAADVVADVNRGTAFLLALAPLDARKAFERAASQDPDCAMAGWGRAMSWLPSDPASFTEVAQREGRDAVRRAAGRGTAREQAYVAAIALVFDQPADVSLPMRLRRYRDAMRDLAAAHPDDTVAALFFARATLLLSTAPDDDFQREAASMVEQRFGASPDQLAPALTMLLARDRPTAPQLAKPAADVVARLATTPLARHLPARTYARLGDWDAAVTSTEAAIKLAGSPASPELVYGPDHTDVAAEWLVDALLQQGKVARAAAVTEDVRGALRATAEAEPAADASPTGASPGGEAGRGERTPTPPGPLAPEPRGQGGGEPGADRADGGASPRAALHAALVRMDVRQILARADWTRGREWVRALGCDRTTPANGAARERAVASPAPARDVAAGPELSSSRDVLDACAFLGGYSAARLAWPGAKPDQLADAARLAEPLGGTGSARTASVRELMRVLVRAAMAAGQEEHPELELLASHAIDLEERLLRSGQLVLPLAPAHELVGDLFFQANRFDQARRHYRDALMAAPNRARSILGTARASVRLDDREAATAAYRRLLDLWDDADPDLPELNEARRWLDVAPRPAAP